MRKATGSQISFSTAIAERLCVPKPNYNSFDETGRFISAHKNDFYLEKYHTKLRKRGFRTTAEFNHIAKDLETSSGIYFLFNDDELVELVALDYIGKGQSLGKRMVESVSEKIQQGSPINKIAYWKAPTHSDMHVAEVALIAKYKPKFNKEYKANDELTMYDPVIDPYSLKQYSIYENAHALSLPA